MPDPREFSTTPVLQLGRTAVVPLPLPPESMPEVDDETTALAEDLEHVVDARSWTMRRVMDVLVAVIALAVLAPVMAIIAVAIKLDSPGPVFYTQDRIGINRRRTERRGGRGSEARRRIIHAGRPFRMWKFRTMRIDAEADGPRWATNGDPRITRLGRFLRRSRLDEVPQFLNVVHGDMTLIGPRPERDFFINILESEVPHYRKRLLVKPGITGMAQVNSGYDDSIDSVRTKVQWDLRYIRRQGLRADVVILVRTIRTILTGDGAW